MYKTKKMNTDNQKIKKKIIRPTMLQQLQCIISRFFNKTFLKY